MIPAMVTRMNYVYAPQLGYHVQIPLENGATEPADIPGMRLGVCMARR
jgi:hypothetical protein